MAGDMSVAKTFNAMAGEERAVVAGASANLQHPGGARLGWQPAQERFPFGQFPLLLIPAIPLVGSAVIGSPQVIAYPLEIRAGHSSCPSWPR